MKYLFIILVLAYSSIYSSDYEWNYVEEDVLMKNFMVNHISALDTSRYVIGKTNVYSSQDSRYIISTEDYAQTWDTLFYEQKPEDVNDYIEYAFTDIEYLDRENIIATYGYHNILRSSDGGATWSDTAFPDSTFQFLRMTYNDGSLFLGESSSPRYAVSENLGKSWVVKNINIQIDSIDNYSKISYQTPIKFNDTLYTLIHLKSQPTFKSNLSYITTSLLICSADDGNTWKKLVLTKEMGIVSNFTICEDKILTQLINFTFEKNIIELPDNGGIDTFYISTTHRQIVSFDKLDGTSSTLVESSIMQTGDLIGIRYYGQGLLSMTTVGASYISKDYGNTWEWEEVNKKTMNSKIARPAINKGIIIGDYVLGTLQPTTSVLQKQNAIQNISVYPNPISSGSKLNLEFEAQESGVYSYKLSSLDGRAMQIERQDYLSTGKAFTAIELGNDFATGVYILSIMKDGEVVAAKKVILE